MSKGQNLGEFEILTLAEIFRLGCAFHEEVLRGTRNPFYAESLKRVNAIRRLFTYRQLADHDHIRRHIREHIALLELIAAGRMQKAAKFLEVHLLASPKQPERAKR